MAISNVRLPQIVADVVTGGLPSVRVPSIHLDVSGGGIPFIRVPSINLDVSSGGLPTVRCPLIVIEALQALLPGPFMSTAVFPTLPGLTWIVTKKPMFSTRISKQQSGREVRSADYPFPIWEFNLSYDYLPNDPLQQGANTDLNVLMGFFLLRQGAFDTFLLKDPTDYTVLGGLQFTGDGVTLQFAVARVLGGFSEPVGQLNTDQLVQFAAGAVNTGTSAVNVPAHGLTTGQGPIAVSSTVALPTGLLATRTYWLIRVDADHFQFATSLANAMSNTFVPLTAAGSGTNTVVRDIAVYDNGVLQDKTAYSITMPNQIVFITAPAAGHLITADFWFYFVCRFLEDSHDYENFVNKLWQLHKCDLQSVIG